MNKETFIMLYRGTIDISECTELDVGLAIEKVELIGQSLLGGISFKTLERQSGLTREELKELPVRSDSIIKRLEKGKNLARKTASIKPDEVYEVLCREKDTVISRLIGGEGKKEIAHDLGVPNRDHSFNRFINEMRTSGYFLHDIPFIHQVMKESEKGTSVDYLIKTYSQFKSEDDVLRFFKVHDIPLDDLDRGKETKVMWNMREVG